jgi:hypothetical protein
MQNRLKIKKTNLSFLKVNIGALSFLTCNLELRHPRCVRYNKMVQVVESKTLLIRWWNILLLRQHVSALAHSVTIDNFQRSWYIKQDHKLEIPRTLYSYCPTHSIYSITTPTLLISIPLI